MVPGDSSIPATWLDSVPSFSLATKGYVLQHNLQSSLNIHGDHEQSYVQHCFQPHTPARLLSVLAAVAAELFHLPYTLSVRIHERWGGFVNLQATAIGTQQAQSLQQLRRAQ
jgi:hypothetical protein